MKIDIGPSGFYNDVPKHKVYTISVTRIGEISPLWQIIYVFGNFLRVYLLFGIHFNPLWHFLNAIGQIFIDVNGQKLKNNLAIWSHWIQSMKDDNKICVTIVPIWFSNSL